MKNNRETVQYQRIILDEKEYKDTHFNECELVITGRGPLRLLNCSFGSNHLGFDGPAARAIDTITAMYAEPTFKPFVEAVLDQIRSGYSGVTKWKQ
ncbi:MAG: hypothetical protein JOZ24_02030 [Candidatus Eremiobacteraeota bacterium]|nr:hypothetical protein [Candidatus Eremiobacteraeota bacterium]